jgi:hypothetical protein
LLYKRSSSLIKFIFLVSMSYLTQLQQMMLTGLRNKSLFSQERCLTDLILSFREYPSKINAFRAGVTIIEYCDLCHDPLQYAIGQNDDEPVNSCETIPEKLIVFSVIRNGKLVHDTFEATGIWCDQQTYVCKKCCCYYMLCQSSYNWYTSTDQNGCGNKMQLLRTMISRSEEPSLIQYSHPAGTEEDDCDDSDCPCHYHEVSKENIHYLDAKKFNCPFGPDGGYQSEWYCKKCDRTVSSTDK